MKKIIGFALAMLPFIASAQIPKSGNVKPEEFNPVPTTPADTAASVYILYHDATSWFSYERNQVFLETQYKMRFLVRKEMGKDYATVNVSYYNNSKSSRENNAVVTGVTACAYNIVDGKKVEKTSMPGKYVFSEQTEDYYKTLKFTVPNVKVGTIVEYKYNIKTPRFWDVPTWYAQREYPVKMAHLSVTYPDYFTFNHFSKGYTNINVKKTPENVNLFSGNGETSISGYQLDCTASDIVALKKEPFLENPRIYATRMEFELLGINVPGQLYKSFANTWDDVRKGLRENERFGKYLDIKTPFQEQLDAIDFSSMNKIEKATTVLSVLKSNVKWNETFALYSNKNPRSAINEGKGTNAELNFLLIAMLKHVGINCTPMLVKARRYGPILAPTLDDFGSFIVAFTGDDNGLYFLDSSSDYGGVNCISPSLLGYGVLYDYTLVNEALPVYNLYDISGNMSVIDVQGLVNENHEVQVQRKEARHGLVTLTFKEAYHEKDSVQYVEDLEKSADINVHSHSLKNVDGVGSMCREVLRFTKTLGYAGDRMYINPLVLPDETSNHFTEESRVCPVEFPYLQSTAITSRLILPDSYEVEELPEARTVSMPDGSVAATISVEVIGNALVTKYRADVNSTLIVPSMYEELRKVWNGILEMNKLTVVLKKK